MPISTKLHPAEGFGVNAMQPTLGHKNISDLQCTSPNSLQSKPRAYVQGVGYSIHNDINSSGVVQPISMEVDGMDSHVQKERHVVHVEGANEDTCLETRLQPTLTEEKKEGPYNRHRGAIVNSTLNKQAIACQGVRMDDNIIQLPPIKKEDKMEKGKLLKSNALQLEIAKSRKDSTSKDLAVKPGSVTDTVFEVIYSSRTNIDGCSIESQDSDKVIASSKHESAFDCCRKYDMIETIDSSANPFGSIGYIDSPGTIPLDRIRENSTSHSGNSVWVKSVDSVEYSLGNTIC